MAYNRNDPFYPCQSCDDLMRGVIAPIPENHHSNKVAREVCEECVKTKKAAEAQA